ncbi:hypothetical protein FB565_006950 [Actinoplanes lutulentus]|uniref:Uncharacterized protein n=1 Tax=Actinoplanes lutulentus TaxID=1287878 RepID=A0A327Z9S0_9ACTN|nr:hypothetical protein [Actinoplanes lutulentus]MBB2947182.1 hypothetical protein [Actinoplanes lutulentus]RAK36457.1 hypothetical protein B0I29_10846 [Actinoplanes lutulentus]
MSPETTLARLADEFLAAMNRHGVHIDRPVVEQEMRERIDAIAEVLRLDTQTVLRDHAQDGWGRQMAAAAIEQIRQDRLLDINWR